LAKELGLKGWVLNSAQGAQIEAEGSADSLRVFLARLRSDAPPQCDIQGLETSWLDVRGYPDFEIRESLSQGNLSAWVLPDIATCEDCLREILNPQDRRYFYPFTNCTNCGPRFSIIEAMPYDRAGTSMKSFKMCPACRAEYEDPSNRRFHAQPNACPECGPELALWDAQGIPVPEMAGASAKALLERTARELLNGKLVALKGLGGFHLCALAGSEIAVKHLRAAKRREFKPLAIMAPSLEWVMRACEISETESQLLQSRERPIVLLRRKSPVEDICDSVAPGNPYLGVMLPYTPLHHLLMKLVGQPMVATSGNVSDEPICTDELEAVSRLSGMADWFLVHNRRIVRHVDDSIVREVKGRELVLRRARGYAPHPLIVTGASAPEPMLAVGAHLKNTVALALPGRQVVLSQHIGDLETLQAHEAFRKSIADLQTLYQSTAVRIVADAHPDYLSSQYALELAGERRPVTRVQHHLAHILGCMEENQLEGSALGVSWDGTGYGLDGSIWGGEFFQVSAAGWERVGHLRRFRLAGGDAAVKDPRRSALGVLKELEKPIESQPSCLAAFADAERAILERMLEKGLNAPWTSSAGRLFDAVAALTGISEESRFEGEAAMALEFALEEDAREAGAYPLLILTDTTPWVLDWRPLILGVLRDVGMGTVKSKISARFHNALAQGIIEAGRQAAETRIVLSGGCFQNRYLLERTIELGEAAGMRVYWPQRVPPNDGGISFGQIIAATRYSG
jgi:hydrogenase maturation protein HypF